MKIFKSKSGLLVTGSIILLIFIFGLGLGATAIYKNIVHPDPEKWDGIDIPLEPETIKKTCNVEGGENCNFGETTFNTPREFMVTCQDFKEMWGNAYFRVQSKATCVSCKDYWDNNGKLPAIDYVIFPTQEECFENLFTPNPECTEIQSKDDCKALKGKSEPICSLPDYEKFCKFDEPEECPDLIIAKVFSFPDWKCQAQSALTKFFFPLRILITFLGGIIAWLGMLWVFQSVKLGKKARQPVAIITAIIVASLIWVIWWVGLIILILILVFRAFLRVKGK